MNTPNIGSLDWEAICLTIRCEDRTWKDVNDIQQRLLQWFKQRDECKECPCELTYLRVDEVGQTSFEVRCEWLCQKCISSFFDYLKAEFRSVKSVESLQTKVEMAQADRPTICVDRREIEFEDGTKQVVEAFQISRMPVSRRQFLDFVGETRYITTAERFGDEETFRENDVIQGLRPVELEQAPVNCVSYLDAAEYCRYAGVRLPSEAEWFSASLITDELLDRQEYGKRFRAPAAEDPRMLKWLSDEITGTLEDNGRCVVVRCGPRWARTTDWRELVQSHRILAPCDDSDIMTSFRVVVG